MIEIRLINDFPDDMLARIIGLYISAKWIKEGDDTSFLLPALKGSFLVAGAFDETDSMIGIARSLSDGCSDAYIQDVVVSPDCRGQGVGRKLIGALVAGLQKNGVDWIALVGEPGTEEFYQKLGWEKKSGFTMWQFNKP
jgi:ribosomal protein S18 acetylase RimI-like enzyme